MKNYYMLFCGLLFTIFCFSQQQDTTQISEVVVQGKSRINEIQKSSLPLHFINSQEINRTDPTIITPILNRVPGVYMQQGALNTNRITIRGVGARSQFSTNRLKAYLNNIPLTSANGETILDDLDLAILENIEISKGPNNTQFGADVGGVIQLKAKQLSKEQNFLSYANLLGSYGLEKQSLQAGHKSKDKQFLVSYHNLQQDGFRANSDYKRESLNLMSEFYTNPNTSFKFIGVFTDLKAFIPSSITQEDLENNPSVAASNWSAAQGFESYKRGLFGITAEQKITEGLQNETSLFTNFKEAYEPRPFDILDESTFGLGLRTNFQLDFSLIQLPSKLNFGLELMQEWHATSNYENLYEDFPNQGSVQGNLFFNIDQIRNYQNYFAALVIELNPKLNLETGLSINSTSFEIKDRFLNNGIDQTSKHRYETTFNPRLGLNYQFVQNQFLFANISRGFSVPTVAESLTPSGILNTDLKPENAWNYEVGTRLNFLNNSVYTELNLFSLQVDNLLVARRTAEDQFLGINAGKTIHNGLESLLKGNINYAEIILQPYFSGTFNFFEFDEFIDRENNFSGNDLTGIPNMQLNLGVDLSWKNLQVFTNWSYVGEIPLNDANSLYADSYRLLNFKVAYQLDIKDLFEIQFNAGINNALNEKYAASILPNAVGFGNSPARFYYPGLPRNYFFGAQINYNFE
ncbi:TonB-dependent receptor family protein [Psychroflexus salis]|uniref:Ligand-gated channel n=1 Tax=Psychroflexus salis TaxID=1526574 RepID=A0A916ZS39_9FLAO|nr:TonB-dependent receptor [Psychroflexus salis]GGE09723.1 ligand-gated channel [Psychroflexus salis]